MNEPQITIIIPAKNAEKTIGKCVGSLLNLHYKNYEIIAVDDCSGDRTPEVLRQYKEKIKIIFNPSCFGPSKSRNIAAQQAGGEYLAFTDADCIVDRNWLNELSLGFDEAGVVSVGGSQSIPEDESSFGRRVSVFLQKAGFISDYMHKKRDKIIAVSHNPSCSVMYKKDIFLKEGGFLEGLWPGEDVELDYRLKRKGYKILFNPQAVVYHYRPQELRSFLKMMYRYGWAQGFLVRKYGTFRIIHIEPIILVILLAFLIIKPFLGLLFTIIVIIVFLARVLFKSRYPLSLLCISLGAVLGWNIGFLFGLCNGQNLGKIKVIS